FCSPRQPPRRSTDRTKTTEDRQYPLDGAGTRMDGGCQSAWLTSNSANDLSALKAASAHTDQSRTERTFPHSVVLVSRQQIVRRTPARRQLRRVHFHRNNERVLVAH